MSRRCGIVYVAFVVDIYSRAIVGWAAATHKRTKLSQLASRWGDSQAALAAVGKRCKNARLITL
jgi:transposase InsO family protein